MVAGPRFTVPVTVILGRHMVGRDGWSVPSWRAVGVVSGEHLPGSEARGLAVTEGNEEQFMWGGLRLELYRDATESYWTNLMGQTPSLFILCAERDDGMLEPMSVTADMHEACSGVEGDDKVFAVPIPPELYQQLEHFVVEHHRPQEKRKRKRTQWTGSEEP